MNLSGLKFLLADQAAAQRRRTAPNPMAQMLQTVLLMGGIGLLMWLMIFRPQQKRAKELEAMLKSLARRRQNRDHQRHRRGGSVPQRQDHFHPLQRHQTRNPEIRRGRGYRARRRNQAHPDSHLTFMNIVTRHPKFFWGLIAFLVLGSLWEMYPLTNQSLIQEFKDKSRRAPRRTRSSIRSSARPRSLQAAKPDPSREFTDLLTAIGTNDIQPYFPYNNVKGQENPTYALLNVLQRKAAGKIHLGLDLQGGTEFRVSLDTNHISATDTNHSAVNAADERKRLVSQAITILRQRVDALGVAEPIITPAGENEISIQLPGLSQAAQDQAKTNIQKAAFLEFRSFIRRTGRFCRNSLWSSRSDTKF